ncbi:hypothetical protein L484_017038 [Morus notabilis]|uniref:Uncharacterized protein n=1 Tax=Morus notabilis TaxID=981085 RepID=W9RKX5_9ROSA|nr:hypothetical protein L484_017038 [Morus notabilis]
MFTQDKIEVLEKMPNLRILSVKFDHSPTDRGVGILNSNQRNERVRELNVTGMVKEFEDRIRVNEDGIEGEDFYKVRHIPSISISDTY